MDKVKKTTMNKKIIRREVDDLLTFDDIWDMTLSELDIRIKARLSQGYGLAGNNLIRTANAVKNKIIAEIEEEAKCR